MQRTMALRPGLTAEDHLHEADRAERRRLTLQTGPDVRQLLQDILAMRDESNVVVEKEIGLGAAAARLIAVFGEIVGVENDLDGTSHGFSPTYCVNSACG
ncbi:hypothetical protein [Bradyrhizobium pachyrhizi]|uniref:hypothetical protein n=1 Tax=Bradyrhizobium pachyrhizi TaxID=280333 RepID=UPI001FD4B7F8|nr:hypothetical protein [Bradyrhizobium pachyrhizi]